MTQGVPTAQPAAHRPAAPAAGTALAAAPVVSVAPAPGGPLPTGPVPPPVDTPAAQAGWRMYSRAYSGLATVGTSVALRTAWRVVARRPQPGRPGGPRPAAAKMLWVLVTTESVRAASAAAHRQAAQSWVSANGVLPPGPPARWLPYRSSPLYLITRRPYGWQSRLLTSLRGRR